MSENDYWKKLKTNLNNPSKNEQAKESTSSIHNETLASQDENVSNVNEPPFINATTDLDTVETAPVDAVPADIIETEPVNTVPADVIEMEPVGIIPADSSKDLATTDIPAEIELTQTVTLEKESPQGSPATDATLQNNNTKKKRKTSTKITLFIVLILTFPIWAFLISLFMLPILTLVLSMAASSLAFLLSSLVFVSTPFLLVHQSLITGFGNITLVTLFYLGGALVMFGFFILFIMLFKAVIVLTHKFFQLISKKNKKVNSNS